MEAQKGIHAGNLIQEQVKNYKDINRPSSFELCGRKILHFITGGFVEINPVLNSTIAAVVVLLNQGDKLTLGHLATLNELSGLARTQGAKKVFVGVLQNEVKELQLKLHEAGAVESKSVKAEAIAERARNEGYFVVNNPHDSVSFSLGTFSPIAVTIDNITYSCAEAAFQASKFVDDETKMKFAEPLSGAAAQNKADFLLKEKNIPNKIGEWDKIALGNMKEILNARLEQDVSGRLKELLLASKNSFLVVHSPNTYWGDGNGKGENLLGKMMMEQRGELRGGVGLVSAPNTYFDKFDISRKQDNFKVCSYNLGGGIVDYQQLDEKYWTEAGADNIDGQELAELMAKRTEIQMQVAENIFNEFTADVFCMQEVGEGNTFLLDILADKNFEVVRPPRSARKLDETDVNSDVAIVINRKRFKDIENHPCLFVQNRSDNLEDRIVIATATDNISGKKVAFISGHISGVALENLNSLSDEEFKKFQISKSAIGDKNIQNALNTINLACADCHHVVFGADFNSSKEREGHLPRFEILESAGYGISFPENATNVTRSQAAKHYINRKLDGFAYRSNDQIFVEHLTSPIKLDKENSPSDHSPEIIELSFVVNKTAMEKFKEWWGFDDLAATERVENTDVHYTTRGPKW